MSDDELVTTSSSEKPKKKHKKANIAINTVGIILLVILIPLLAMELTLVIKGYMYDMPPDLFGYAPLSVVSNSMHGDSKDSFDEGDLIFVKVLDQDEVDTLEVGDVICYFEESGSSKTFITHRITTIYRDSNGSISSIVTWGDNRETNTSEDPSILPSQVFGVYAGKLKGVGNFAKFLQTPVGIVTVVGIPLVIFIIIDVSYQLVTRRHKDNELVVASEDKDKEIERLNKLLEEKNKDLEDNSEIIDKDKLDNNKENDNGSE